MQKLNPKDFGRQSYVRRQRVKKIAMAILVSFLGVTLLAVTSCQSVSTQAATSEVLPWKQPAWDKILRASIESEMPKLNKASVDMTRFCPRYGDLSTPARVNAWAHLMVGMAKYESGYNPGDAMEESTGAISQGLFQLTYGDTFCPKRKSEGDLNDPSVNIRCATRLLAHLSGRDGVVTAGGRVKAGQAPARGGADYWAVLMEPDLKPWKSCSKRTGKCKMIHSQHKLKEIRALAAAAPGCS